MCECRIGGADCEAEIVAVSEDSADISLEDDFGDRIREVRLSPKKNQLAEMLVKRLESLLSEDKETLGFNHEGCNKVFGFVEPGNIPSPIPLDISAVSGFPPNQRQMDAIRSSLSKEVTFIWGPPGTGKTRTLTVILEHLLSSGRRILLTSHTNLAVDEILSKYIEDPLAQRFVRDGKIVRHGKLSKNDPALEALTIDQITENKAKKYLNEIARIDRQIAEVQKSLSYFESTSFKVSIQKLDALRQVEEEKKTKVRQVEKELKDIQEKAADQLKKTSKLEKSLADQKNSGFLSRMFSGDKAERLQNEITVSTRQHTKLLEKQKSLELACNHVKSNIRSSGGPAEKAESDIRKKAEEENITLPVTINSATIRTQMKPLQEKISGYKSQIRVLKEKIDEIGDSVLKEAAVVGCTLAKVYADRSLHTEPFDVMILDEASMAQLPAVYFAAGLTRESHYIISGDFRQLSPISQCSEKNAKKWLLRSIFDQAGIEEAANNGTPDKRLIMLNEQFRMHPGIAALINGPMYHGNLKTGEVIIPQKEAIAACSPFEDKPAVLIDTSSLNPWSKRPGSSKINLYHAMIATELTRQILEGGTSSVGIIAPYKAQSDLITTMLENAGIPHEKAMAATVHKFQGNERECIIYDTVEGEGTGTKFMQGEWTNSEAGRLLNVAISRAEGKFIMIANARYCIKRFGPEDALLGLIEDLQDSGFVTEPEDVLPLGDDALTMDTGTELSITDASECSLWDEHTFYPLFAEEVRNAEESIVIFSPFMTKYRISQLMDDFRKAISRGVRIVCIVREPKDQGSLANVQDTYSLADECRRVGIEIVTPAENRSLSRNFHEKLAFIDHSLVFYGSLNILSQNDSTESMMAMRKPEIVEEMRKKFMVNMFLVPNGTSVTADTSASGKAKDTCMSIGENRPSNSSQRDPSGKSSSKPLVKSPSGYASKSVGKSSRSTSSTSSSASPRTQNKDKKKSVGQKDDVISRLQKNLPNSGTCPICGSPMRLQKKNHNFYLLCEKHSSGCKGKQIVPVSALKGATGKAQIACQKCGKGRMILREGKYGPFLGCSKYPECRNIVNIR